MYRYKTAAILLCVFYWIFSLWLHTNPYVNTMIHTNLVKEPSTLVSNESVQNIVNYHKTLPDFAKRPLTTYLIEQNSRTTGLSTGWSFVLLNFTLFAICGYLIFYLGALWTNERYGLFSQLFFFSSFSILFAFVPCVFSYDEPLQYALILFSFIFLHYNKSLLFIFFFTGSLIARETGLLLIPFLLTQKNLLNASENSKPTQRIYLFIVPVIVYLIYFFTQPFSASLSSRPKCLFFNFQNIQFSIDALVSLLIACGLPIYISCISKKSASPDEKKSISAFYLLLIVNAFIILIFARAREIRLFALPLLLWWPFSGKLVLENFYGKLEFKLLKSEIIWFALLIIGSIILSILFAFYVYKPTGVDPHLNFQRPYLCLMLILIFAHFSGIFIQSIRKKKPTR
jgi:hypothetical protein